MTRKQNKIKILRIFLAIMVVIHLGAIFIFSQQDGTDSSTTSSNVTRSIVRMFNNDFDKMPQEKQDEMVETMNGTIRTFAHGISFSLVGFWFAMLYSTINIKFYKVYGLSAGSSLIYAGLDELHQHFIPGRACELQDILVDFSGALIGSLIGIALYVLIKKVSKDKKAKKQKKLNNITAA